MTRSQQTRSWGSSRRTSLQGVTLISLLGIVLFLLQSASSMGNYQIMQGGQQLDGRFLISCNQSQIEVNNMCVDCNASQYASNNTCMDCDDGCLSCEFDGANCIECDIGYFFSDQNMNFNSSDNATVYNSTCLPCANECQSCGGTAENCTDTQTVISEYVGSCSVSDSRLLCETHCLRCTCGPNFSTICTLAQQGFTINSSGKIEKCIRGCKTCSAQSLDKCTTCFSNYFLSGDQLSCTACDSSCAQCTSASVCSLCVQGLFVNPTTKKCEACSVSNCAECNGNNGAVCNICKSGYLKAQSGATCIACLSSCSKCDQSNILNCQGCADGYYLDGSQCKSCPSGCKICTSATNCDSCFPGFRRANAANSQTCVQNCQFPCMSCSDVNPTYCIGQCAIGYRFNRGQCQIDIRCNTNQTCTVCPKGYKLQLNGTCTICGVSQCSECSEVVSNCTACKPGFFLSSNTSCASCGQGCKVCYDDRVCYQCTSGYTISSTTSSSSRTAFCIKCAPNCLTCSGKPSSCTSCAAGFTFKGWRCTSVNNIEYSITLNDGRTAQVFAKDQSYLGTIRSLLNTTSTNNFDDHTMLTLIQGSIIQTGIISTSQLSQCEQYANLANSLSVGSTLNGNQIESATFSPSNAACIANNQANVSLAIILAVSLSLLALIVLGLLVFVLVSKNNIEPQAETDQYVEKEKKSGVQTESQFKADQM